MTDLAEIAQGFGVALAALLGGIWTVYLFCRQREQHPKAELDHAIAVTPLSSGKIFVRLGVTIRNVGKVLIAIDEGFARVQRVLPSDKDEIQQLHDEQGKAENYPEIDWQELDSKSRSNWDMEIEPGESDEAQFDFLLDEKVEMVTLYSHFANKKKHAEEKSFGWHKTTLCDLRDAGAGS